MAFEIPEPGSPEMEELLCSLDARCQEIADSWAVIVTDDETGLPVGSFGPFAQPEQALIEVGRQEVAWKDTDAEEDAWSYFIVPIWEPSR